MQSLMSQIVMTMQINILLGNSTDIMISNWIIQVMMTSQNKSQCQKEIFKVITLTQMARTTIWIQLIQNGMMIYKC